MRRGATKHGIITALTFLFVFVLSVGWVDAASETVLYSFKGNVFGPGPNGGPNGNFPETPVIVGTDGTLYGTTIYGGVGCGYPGCGTVYAVKPPIVAGGAWTESTIYAPYTFSAWSLQPSALVAGANGTLFGTTPFLPGSGMVFELTPPASTGGAWTATIPYVFGSKLRSPTLNPLLAGSNRILFGTAALGSPTNLGGMFALAPPTLTGGAWQEIDLHILGGSPDGAFGSISGNLDSMLPSGGLLARGASFYGVTFRGGASDPNAEGFGVVYRVTPLGPLPSALNSRWTETILYAFMGGADGGNPVGNLIADANGVLYGVAGAATGSIVFALTPPKIANGPWTESVIHTFSGGSDGLGVNPTLVIQNGAIYGTTVNGGGNYGCAPSYAPWESEFGCGSVFALTPPSTSGGPWSETIVHSFTGLRGDGAFPKTALAAGPNGVLYGTTFYGGANGVGTVYEIRP